MRYLGREPPYPLGRDMGTDGARTSNPFFLRGVAETRSRLWPCSIRGRRRTAGTLSETRVELTEVDGFVWHGYLPGIAPGPAVRLPGATGPHDPPRGLALRRLQAAARPVRQRRFEGEGPLGNESLFDYRFRPPPPGSGITADSAAYMPKNVVINPVSSTGATNRAPQDPPTTERDRHLRGARWRGADPVPSRRSRRSSAAPTPGPRPPGGDSAHLAQADSGVTAVELHAGAPVRGRAVPGRPRPEPTTGGYQNTIGFPGPATTGTSSSGPARRSRSASSSRW